MPDVFSPVVEIIRNFVFGNGLITAMKNNFFWSWSVCIAAVIFLTGCPNKENKKNRNVSGPTHSVVVSNLPLQFFVNQLAGDKLTVISPGDSPNPRTWSPDDDTIGRMQKADLVFTHGADYEQWLNYISLDESKIVEVARSLHKQFIEIQGEVHKHGPEGKEHAHDGLANYFWLSPALAADEVNKIAATLIETYPELQTSITENKNKLLASILKLQKKIETTKKQDIVVFASDPRFAYLTRDLGWTHVYFHWTNHGKEELPADAWKKLDDALTKNKPATMLFPFAPSAKTKQELDKRKISVLVLDSIESESGGKNYLKRLEALIDGLTIEQSD